MYYSEEENKQFYEAHSEMFSALKDMGWEMSEDPEIRELSFQLYRQVDQDSERAIILTARTLAGTASTWIEQYSSWESHLDREVRIQQRKGLMASCFEKQVTAEFVEDTRRRWEKQEFSAVTSRHIVIGDVYTLNLSCQDLKDEVQFVDSRAQFGKANMTADLWKRLPFESIRGVRPKINGEPFLHRKKEHSLQGFKKFIVPKNFKPNLVEYYAGKFYVIEPIIAKPLEYELYDGAQKNVVKFLPHPLLTITAYLAQKETYCTHQYDGLMLMLKDGEVRTKWFPSLETKIDGEMWEVCLEVSSLRHLRPRPGKKGTDLAGVKSWLHTQISSHTLVRFFEVGPKRTELFETDDLVTVHGVKCLFFQEEKIYLIREPEKRLDLVGGRVEFGEDPMTALLREVEEETGLRMKAEDFVKLGITEEITDTKKWVSHVFVALAPKQLSRQKYIETFEISKSFIYFSKSSCGHPWQAWLLRHLQFLDQHFASMMELQSLAFLVLGGDKPAHVYVSDVVWERILERYSVRLHFLLQNNSIPALKEQGYLFPSQIMEKIHFDCNSLVQGDKDARLKAWSLFFQKESLTRFEVRIKLRQFKCTWSDGFILKKLKEAVEEGVLKQNDNAYSAV
jgi:ADP-ribose pyrophosphatase YjhB (NUDIX family)